MGMSYWSDSKFVLEGFIEEYATDTVDTLHILCSRVDSRSDNAREVITGFSLLMLLRLDTDMRGVPRDIHQAARKALDDEAYGSKHLQAMYEYIY